MKKRKFKVSLLFGKTEYWQGHSKRLAKKIAKRESVNQGMDKIYNIQEVVCVRTNIQYDFIYESGCCFSLGKRDNGWINPENVKKFKKY